MARDVLLYYGLRYYGPSAQRPSTGTCTCCTPYYYLPSLPRYYCCAPLLLRTTTAAAPEACSTVHVLRVPDPEYYEYPTLSSAEQHRALVLCSRRPP